MKNSDHHNNNKKRKLSISTGKLAVTLNKLMHHHSLSYRKFSMAVGVTHPYLYRLSKGQHANPGIDAINKISTFFKVSIPQLLGELEIDFKKRPKKLVDLDFSNDRSGGTFGPKQPQGKT